MGGFLVLEDGRAYAASNWAFDALNEILGNYLLSTHKHDELANWLLEQRVEVVGIGNVDLRELTEANRQLLMDIIPKAYAEAKQEGPGRFGKPEYFDGWLQRFGDLVKMIELVKKGKPPAEFNPHMKDIVPPTGGRSGPGWS